MRVFCVWSVLKKIIPIQTYNWLTAAITKFYGHFGVEWTFRLGRYFLGHPIKIATIIFWNEPKWIITIVSRKWNWVIHFLCIEYHMWHLARSLSRFYSFFSSNTYSEIVRRDAKENRIGIPVQVLVPAYSVEFSFYLSVRHISSVLFDVKHNHTNLKIFGTGKSILSLNVCSRLLRI